jgi:hypothetical protein
VIARHRPAVVVSLITGLALLVTSGRYGYHRDELYFLAAGRHLDWGYPDQPPLVPLLARAFDTGSLVVLRLPSSLAAAVVVLLAGLMAERLGARRSGQWLAAGGTALGGIVLGVGHLLSTSTFLVLGTVLVLHLVVVLRTGGDRRLWLLVGLIGGLTFQAHVLVGLVLLTLAMASRLRRGQWLAGLIALVIGLPYLIWQAQNGMPQLEVAGGIAAGGSTSSVPRSLYLVFLVLQCGPWLAPVWLCGLWRALRAEALRPIALSFLMLITTFLVMGGKPYYVAGFVPFFLAAGAQPVIDKVAGWVAPVLLALSVPAGAFTLPLLPTSALGPVVTVNPDAGETVGWESYAAQVSAVVPEGSVVVTDNYGQAGALERYTDLAVYSGHNGYGLWGIPHGSNPAVLVGVEPDFCTSTSELGRIAMPVDNEENGTRVVTCVPIRPWVDLWPSIRRPG